MKDTKITPEEYNNILKSLELKSISLIESGFKISDENNIAGKVNLKMSDGIFDTMQSTELKFLFDKRLHYP